MNPNQTGPLARTCAVTGEETTGKLYVLRTTDGPEELISPEALLGASVGDVVLQVLEGMQAHIDRLEERLQELEHDDVQADGDAAEEVSADRLQEAAQEAAAPVKKARAPRQRGASD